MQANLRAGLQKNLKASKETNNNLLDVLRTGKLTAEPLASEDKVLTKAAHPVIHFLNAVNHALFFYYLLPNFGTSSCLGSRSAPARPTSGIWKASGSIG